MQYLHSQVLLQSTMGRPEESSVGQIEVLKRTLTEHEATIRDLRNNERKYKLQIDQLQEAIPIYQNTIRRIDHDKARHMYGESVEQKEAKVMLMEVRQRDAALQQSGYKDMFPEDYANMLEASNARSVGVKLKFVESKAKSQRTPTYYLEVFVPNDDYTRGGEDEFFKLAMKKILDCNYHVNAEAIRSSVLKTLDKNIFHTCIEYKTSYVFLPKPSVFRPGTMYDVLNWVRMIKSRPETAASAKPVLQAYVFGGEPVGAPARTAFFCETH